MTEPIKPIKFAMDDAWSTGAVSPTLEYPGDSVRCESWTSGSAGEPSPQYELVGVYPVTRRSDDSMGAIGSMVANLIALWIEQHAADQFCSSQHDMEQLAAAIRSGAWRKS